MPAAVGPVAPRGPAANGALPPMFAGPGGAPGPMGPMGFYPGAMGPQPPRGPGGEIFQPLTAPSQSLCAGNTTGLGCCCISTGTAGAMRGTAVQTVVLA